MAESDPKAADPKPKRTGRSPSYPGITLQVALGKATAQYEAEGKYAIPLSSAFKAWGYSEKSSGGREVRASLRYFGLISIEGEGDTAKVKLTDDAYRVIEDRREDQTEKKAIIKRLALNPSAHKKLWAKFANGIKSDQTAVHFLVHEEEYNREAAQALVAQFKATAAYAGIYEPDSIPVILPDSKVEDDQADGEDDDLGEQTPSKRRREPVKAGMKEDVFTLKEGDVVMQWPERLSSDSFADLETWTTLMLRKIKREAVETPGTTRSSNTLLAGLEDE